MAPEAAPDETVDAYDALLEEYERISNLNGASGVLRWDQQVMMPEGGTPARSKQLSTLSSLSHELLVEGDIPEHLDALEDADLDDEQAAVVREVSRRYERAAAVPNELVEELSETTSKAHEVWQEAKAEDDFEHFAPTLERIIELNREYAEHIDPERDPYAVLFEEYEPYLGLETAERVLERLRDELVPLIDRIQADGRELPTIPDGTYDEGTQEALVRDALDALGYDWERGRLDTAPHPFSTGTMFDARVTTRFDESEPLSSLLSTIHEFGHATYTQGLPDEHYGSPLGEPRDLTVHESQSRFWENHVGRTEPFFELFLPTMQERFDALGSLSTEEAYQAVNRIYPENLIRVEADELTYHMHIVLRFEIERDLISGDLDVAEIPQVWNEKMEEYLGVRPETDAEGCLQDIHWSNGTFGYFPTYSLGSVLAAQLDHALRSDIDDVDGTVRAGEFDPIHEWLTENVHRHGARYRTDELVEEATGEPYTAEYFIDYVEEKFGELYGVSV